MADFSKRTKSIQRNSAVTAGYMCDFRHVTGGAEQVSICPAGSVITLTSINIAPGSGAAILFCGSDIVAEFTVARDYKQGFYAYAPVTLSIPDATGDVTIYFSPPAKGSIAGQ